MLYPPTCVGFGTGSNRLPRGFSWKYGLTHFTQLLRPTPQLARSAFYNFSTYVLSRGRPEPRRATLLRHPIGIAPIWRDRNIYLLCIDYAFRPRLSSRLTLGGLALPRKPWVYGGGVFHAPLATHASILTSGRSTPGRPDASPRTESSPTTGLGRSAASVPCLAPYIVGACPLDQ